MQQNWRKFTLIFTCAFLTAISLWAQPKINSPYSRIGIGDPFQQYFSNTAGLAGMSAAYIDRYQLNILNPAASAYMWQTAMQVELYARNSAYENPQENVSDNIWSGNLANLAIGFPLNNIANDVLSNKKRKLFHGMTFALLPYSLVGYNVQIEEPIEGTPNDTVRYEFQGNGGTYRFVWGNSIRYKDFSFGLNLGYLFGNISNERQVTFPGFSATFRDEITEESVFSGFIWSFGFMYHKQYNRIDKNGKARPTGKFLTLGLYGSSENRFKVTSSETFFRVNNPLEYGRELLDTLNIGEATFTGNKLPGELVIGARTGHNRWDLGAEIGMGFWEQYRNKVTDDLRLSNTFRVAIGGSIQPKKRIPDLAREVRYSAGLFFQTDPRSDIFNEQLTNFGVTLGAKIPFKLRDQSAFTNVAVELGTLGTEDALKENYLKLTLGFTLNDDSWFRKRKFY